MTNENVWGSLGNTIFQMLTSPVYGSYSKNRTAKYTEYERIQVADPVTGIIQGQKPLKEAAGLDLSEISFDCYVANISLYQLDLNFLEKLARAIGLGDIAGSVIGSVERDDRFRVDVKLFLDQLNAMFVNQTPNRFFIGDEYHGLYSIDELKEDVTHNRNGSIKTATVSLTLREWVE